MGTYPIFPGAVIQKKECLLVEQDDAGSIPAGAAIFSGA
jgi:hypothetical protein